MKTQFLNLPEIEGARRAAGAHYREFLRVPALSAGLYVLAAGAMDLQKPHREDEIYYVLRGKARFRTSSEDRRISPGTVIFVPAHEEHRFYDIEEELALLVTFGPAETE